MWTQNVIITPRHKKINETCMFIFQICYELGVNKNIYNKKTKA